MAPAEPHCSGPSLPSRLEKEFAPEECACPNSGPTIVLKFEHCCLRDRLQSGYSLWFVGNPRASMLRCQKRRNPTGPNRRVSPYATTRTEPELHRGLSGVRVPSSLHHQQQDKPHGKTWFEAKQCKLCNAQPLDFLEQQFRTHIVRATSYGGWLDGCLWHFSDLGRCPT